MTKWIFFIGLLAIYTGALYLIFRPKIEEHNQIAKEKPYWAEEGFKPDTVRIPYPVEGKMVPYPIEMPPKEVTLYDTVYQDKIKYVNQADTTQKLTLPSYYGKYPFLVSGDFEADQIALTLGDTKGNIRTEIYKTNHSDYQYRYTNSSMTTAQKSTRPPLETARKVPFVRYDKTFVEYKHDFINSGKTVGITTGVTIKDRVQLSGFGELGLNNNIPDQAGVKIGFKIF